MAGRKGRSGRHPMTAAEHVLRGTYRPARHGPLPDVLTFPAAPATMLQGQSTDDGWSPSRADLGCLGRSGKVLVSEWREVHVMNLREGVILLAAARCRDNADLWQRRSRVKGPAQARHARLALAFEKEFASLIASLKVQP